MDDVNNKFMMIINNKKVRIVVKTLIILLFIFLSFVLATRHEHWSDEAQSFLLARDTTVSEIFYYMRYEGTPPLWVFTIKLFLLLGGTYKTLYILPIIFSTIGLIIFEFKIKVPWYIKLLFPFTYFIFYQYTIVARSYCLVLPLLMLITVIYKKRFEKPILYTFLMYLFMNISLHTLVVAGSFYLIDIIYCLLSKNKIKSKKILCMGILLFILFAVTALITYPAVDCVILPRSDTNLFHVLAESTIGSDLNKYLEVLLSIIIIFILMHKIDYYKKMEVAILMIPIVFVLIIIRFQIWYTGIIWLLMFVIFVINDKINTSKLVKLFVLCVCLVQSYWSICSFNYDYNNPYSASLEMANYLKEYVKEDKIIYGVGFSKTAIQPYFEKNIFSNKLTDKAFHIWAYDSQELVGIDLMNDGVDIFVISERYEDGYHKLINFLELMEYEKSKIEGYTYIKNRIYETESYIIYEKNK